MPKICKNWQEFTVQRLYFFRLIKILYGGCALEYNPRFGKSTNYTEAIAVTESIPKLQYFQVL